MNKRIFRRGKYLFTDQKPTGLKR